MRRLLSAIQSQIRYKIILPYLALMLLVTLAGAAIALALTAASWEERLTEQLKQIGRNTSVALLQRERDHLVFLRLIAFGQANESIDAPSVADAFASGDAETVKNTLRPYYNFNRENTETLDVDRMIAIDKTGKALVDWLRVANDEQPAELAGTDLSAVADIKKVLGGTPAGENDKFSNLILFTPDLQPYFYTVVPVKQGDNVVGGVLIAIKVDRMLKGFERTSQSVATNYYNVDGQALGSSLLRRDDELPNFAMRPETLQLLQSQADTTVFDTVSLRGNSYEFAYSPLLIAGTQVGYFSVGISRDFQVESISLSRNVVIAITMSLAIGAVLVGYYIARMITKPLGALVETAEAVAHGNLEQRTVVESSDELGRLAQAFNQMTEHLLRLYMTSRELSKTIEVGAVLDVTARTVRSLLSGTEVLALLDERGAWTYRLPPEAPEALLPMQTLRLSASDPLLLNLAQSRAPHVLTSAEEPHLAMMGLTGIAGFQTVLMAPLVIQDTLAGVLIFGHPDPRAFNGAIVPTLTAIANMATSVLYNAVLFSQAHEEASERQAILQSIADGVVVCDNQRNIVLVNEAAQKMLGLPDQQLVRRNFNEVPLERVEVRQDLFGGNSPALERFRLDDRVFVLSSAPVIVEGERTLGEVIVLHDISAEAAVDLAKTKFIETISHELRTPLTVISGYNELLLRGLVGELSAEQRELLEQMRVRTDHMTNLVHNVITVASIESRTMRTEVEVQDLELSIESVLASMRKSFAKKGLDLLVDLPEDLPQVTADREQLRLILTQLLDNARRYTQEGSVTVRAIRRREAVQIDIVDTGPGIAPEEFNRLFTRFHRIEGNNSPERGSGLGLAITRQLVERQGGTVWARSDVGHGSTFSFTLPLANGQADAVLGQDTTNTTA